MRYLLIPADIDSYHVQYASRKDRARPHQARKSICLATQEDTRRTVFVVSVCRVSPAVCSTQFANNNPPPVVVCMSCSELVQRPRVNITHVSWHTCMYQATTCLVFFTLSADDVAADADMAIAGALHAVHDWSWNPGFILLDDSAIHLAIRTTRPTT